ncbi:DUF2523 family protein [Vibrio sp. Sgm 22]|uniref:DUF2523 family protein n=1 Tax=Vibrio TaxID=662 RepID=UPI00037EB908|nr:MULTISPECIES: DUF2523 family protein [Vibrio]MCX2759899.1 DUF2523 family protein [Vibrio sp. 14G-20]MCX2776886.1 DUF2523 family protein [Vibrio sp. Sgm 22]OED70986.1 VSK receptor [Vibrio crassostreae ZF-91]
MDWIVTLFNKLIEFLYKLILSLVDMLKDMVFWIVEQFMSAVNSGLSWAVNAFQPVDIGQYLQSIPPNVAWVMGAVGLPQCLSLIISAIALRMILQLIPFTRLGS